MFDKVIEINHKQDSYTIPVDQINYMAYNEYGTLIIAMNNRDNIEMSNFPKEAYKDISEIFAKLRK